MPRHRLCTPETSRSAASCAQIHPPPTEHGSWVLVSTRKSHEPISPCDDYYNRFRLRSSTRTESRMSVGPSTAAARNHGAGGPTTGTMHHERAQVRVIRGGRCDCHTRPQQPPSWTRLFAIRERRARGTAVSEVIVVRSSGRTRGGLSDPPHPAKKPRATTKIPDGYRGATRERGATTREPNTRRHDTRRHGDIRKVIARKHRDGDGDAIAHRNHRRHARGHANSYAGGRRLRSSVAAAAAAARRHGDSAAQNDTWAAAWCSRHRTRAPRRSDARARAPFLFRRARSKMNRQEGIKRGVMGGIGDRRRRAAVPLVRRALPRSR